MLPFLLLAAVGLIILALCLFRIGKLADKQAFPKRPDEELQDLTATRH